MGFILKENSKTEFKILEAGSYPARCYSFVDLGTQSQEWQGAKKEKRKGRFSFEFPTELEVFKEEIGLQPFSLSVEFTLSLHEQGKLRPFLESWRGKQFTADELEGFDIVNVLGAECMINVIHTQGKNGNTYANIAGIGRLPKGMTCPDIMNPLVEFSLDDFSQNTFDSLPVFLQDKIKLSKEYKDIFGDFGDL